ncbi:prolyl oligopeptidase family serine peptidase [Porphyromonadaceae bacterium W3.11]|nr:prolyl oligopeptidase family serine peptidase [Porphyromonadaceae bacterium W3.11]
MKKISFLLCLLLTPLVLLAQNDTISISKLGSMHPVSVSQLPFMADSINITGEKYDPTSLLKPIANFDFSNPKTRIVESNGEGIYTISTKGQLLRTYAVSLLSDKYEKVSLLIESNVPYFASLDGSKVAKSTQFKDQLSTPSTHTLQLTPSRSHLLVFQIISSDEKDSSFRLRLAPESDNSNLQVRLDNKEYLSLEYMMTGKSLYSTSVSPSGKYMLLISRESINNKSHYSTTLYEEGQPKAQLPEEFQFASWMPSSDRLYTTRKDDNGRHLVTFDPSTFQTEVLAKDLPKGGFSISPSEDALIFMVEQEGPKKGEIIERVMGRYDRMDGYRDRTFLAYYDLKTGVYRPLTYGYRSTALHSISNDGKEIIFSNSIDTTKSPFSEGTYYTMNLETLEVTTLFENSSSISRINYTSDPRYLLISGDANAFEGIGINLPEGMVVNTYDGQLFLYDLKEKKAFPLTKEFDPSVGSVKVLPDAFVAYFTAENKDRKSLYRLDLKSRKITQVATTEDLVRSFDVNNTGKVLSYTGQSALNSDRFYSIKNNREHLILDLSKEKIQNIVLGEMHDWNYTMPNGDNVQGRYYLPPNFDASKKYPMLVYYYGGTSPTSRFFEGSYSLPMFAGQGYIVLTVNPSGTTGFGQEYSSRHVNAWGKVTADEIIAATKGFCAEHAFVNADKIGCLGASYGGFMTQYLQTVTDIFAAAVSHAGISAISSYWGEGTWGIGYCTVANNESYPWNNAELFVKQSPLFNADKINTPILLLHGTADTNVPIGESIQMYNALKILGKEVEFIKVHGEDHIITDPIKKIEWSRSIFAWFQKWLKDDPTWWNDRNPEVNL